VLAGLLETLDRIHEEYTHERGFLIIALAYALSTLLEDSALAK
jgi:hypothetical protein